MTSFHVHARWIADAFGLEVAKVVDRMAKDPAFVEICADYQTMHQQFGRSPSDTSAAETLRALAHEINGKFSKHDRLSEGPKT